MSSIVLMRREGRTVSALGAPPRNAWACWPLSRPKVRVRCNRNGCRFKGTSEEVVNHFMHVHKHNKGHSGRGRIQLEDEGDEENRTGNATRGQGRCELSPVPLQWMQERTRGSAGTYFLPYSLECDRRSAREMAKCTYYLLQ